MCVCYKTEKEHRKQQLKKIGVKKKKQKKKIKIIEMEKRRKYFSNLRLEFALGIKPLLFTITSLCTFDDHLDFFVFLIRLQILVIFLLGRGNRLVSLKVISKFLMVFVSTKTYVGFKVMLL